MEERKKKKSHFFEIYIQKVLKQVSPNSALSSDAKQQFNSFLCTLAKKLSKTALELTIFAKKKTISEKEVCNALIFVLSGEILTNSISEGDRAVSNFSETQNSKSSRQSKANIIFPPSITEKFLRDFGTTRLFIKSSAPIFLAAVLEYITSDILSSASINCIEEKRTRIVVKDIELSVRNDSELDRLIRSLNFLFIGGGVVPFIHPLLLQKKPSKPSTSAKRKFRPGTVALREIKKYQKNSQDLLLPKSAFQSVIRTFFKESSETDVKVSADVFVILQHFIENYIINLLRDANFLAIHSNRVKLTSIDIALISYLRGETKNPYMNLEIETDIDIEKTLCEYKSGSDTSSNEELEIL